MTMSALAWASAGAGAARPPARTSDVTMARSCLMMRLLSSRTSVREWPDAEVIPDVPPQAVQTVRLHDQEEYDQGAEHHEAEVGDKVQHGLRIEEHTAEGLHADTDDDGQERDEDGAEDRTQDGPEPSDDDHGQVVDRHADLELLVVGDAKEVGVEHPGHARVEGRDGEGQKLVAEDVDANDLRGDVLVADSDEGAPHAAAHEIHGSHDRDDHEDEQEVVHVALAGEHHRAQ